jgi:dTDP-4-amino-4,6-dideoxygalactose transaminase
VIPLVDLQAQLGQIQTELQAGFARVLAHTGFILGREVGEFEEAFARFSGVRHCVGVGSGTDALEMILRAIGVGPEDEVLVPANSFIASALAVVRAGARPVLVDCDPEYLLIDPRDLERKISEHTRAIMPVDLYGQVAPMEQIEKIAEEAGAVIVEDAAQAHGAKRNGRGAGDFGAAAAFSFYPGKNLGALGDAGAVLTNDEDLAGKMRQLRNYGSEVKYHHPRTGFNSRLDTLQAMVLLIKLKRLPDWNSKRRQAARTYDDLLSSVPEATRPVTLPGNQHVWHLYTLRVPGRDRVLKHLNDRGIGAGIHYPVPIHLQGAFAHLGHRKGDFPVTERAAETTLSLPLFPEITPKQQRQVVDTLKEALR